METTRDTEALQKDKDSKAKMKAYADQKLQVKPHNLNAGDITLVNQRRLNKASPHFEPVPYTVLDVKGSMITTRRATDQKEVTRNSSHFKKLPNVPGSTIPDTEPVPANEQVPIDFEGPEICQPAPTAAPFEESSRAHPSDTNGNQDNTTLAATELSTPSPVVSSRSGRLIKKPGWMKDYVMTRKTLLIVRTFVAKLICLRSHSFFML